MAFLVYTGSLATPGNTATNGSANTETEVFFIKPGVRTVTINQITMGGKGAALTTLSAIAGRCITWGTASTSGTTVTPAPNDPGAQAAKMTSASAPTAGTTRLNKMIFVCGGASPGIWQKPDVDSGYILEGGAALSFDLLSVSGTTSMNMEWAYQAQE